MIKAVKIVRTNTDIEYWVSSSLDMSGLMRLYTVNPEKAQHNCIELATRAFLLIEYHCFVNDIFGF
ncbi:MAG: hypothetical protein ACTFAL_12700 [Candidatus Electronema sp. V4]|uniref:hypothetical protein n=1 Tax=Candidatus Electronema sp. V4 TaxID=3454756 RepID=UPI00405574D8